MTMANWITAPLWPLAIFSAEKTFQNPLLRNEQLNRRGLYATRVKVAHVRDRHHLVPQRGERRLVERALHDEAVALEGGPLLRGLAKRRRQRLAGLVSAPDPQNDLHMDTFHPTVKAWLWLDDVDEDMGPFAMCRARTGSTGTASPGTSGAR